MCILVDRWFFSCGWRGLWWRFGARLVRGRKGVRLGGSLWWRRYRRSIFGGSFRSLDCISRLWWLVLCFCFRGFEWLCLPRVLLFAVRSCLGTFRRIASSWFLGGWFRCLCRILRRCRLLLLCLWSICWRIGRGLRWIQGWLGRRILRIRFFFLGLLGRLLFVWWRVLWWVEFRVLLRFVGIGSRLDWIRLPFLGGLGRRLFRRRIFIRLCFCRYWR